jgi:hypothetical protein
MQTNQPPLVLHNEAQVEAHITDGYIAVRFSDGTCIALHPSLAANLGKELVSMSVLLVVKNAEEKNDQRP